MKKTVALILLLSSSAAFSGPLSGILAYAATKVLCNGTIQAARPSEPHRKAPSEAPFLAKEVVETGSDKIAKTIRDSGLTLKAMEVTNSTAAVVGDKNLPFAVEGTSFAVATFFFWLPLP